MDWTKPSFEEINMSAEIGAYQGDDDGRDNEPTVAATRLRPRGVDPQLVARAAPGPRVHRPAAALPQWNCGCVNCSGVRARNANEQPTRTRGRD